MPYSLSPNVHHAIADGRNIFLDVERDRYFALPEPSDYTFGRYISGQQLDQRDHEELQRLIGHGLLVEGSASHHRKDIEPRGRQSVLDGDFDAPADMRVSARAVIAIITAKRAHRKSTLADLLRHIEAHALPPDDAASLIELRRFAFAFRRATFLTRTRDECLPCSIALTISLRRTGIAARLVMGVSGRPFAAHCWVQVGDLIVNDALDHVATFTPILVQ